MIKTFQYRIKNPVSLNRMASSVNFVWNYCNELTAKRWRESRKILSWVELCRLMAGASTELGISSYTLHQIVRHHADKRNQAKMARLSWRSRERSLGWVPFRADGVSVKGDTVRYYGKTFRVWLSRPNVGTIKGGSFSQDARGNWYVNLQCEVEPTRGIGQEVVGIDLGLKDQAVLSSGAVYSRENITKRYAERLAMAQRARKTRRVTAIHAKIKNSRKDWAHKTTTEIARNSAQIFVGNVSPTAIKRRFAKSVSDAGWYQFKTMLEYKAIGLGVGFKEINEAFSTITCSACNERTGPSGLGSVGVREWDCSHCGAHHNRDVNAAKNILAFGLGHQAPKGAVA